MLLSAVSVLVVAPSSSEIPEGLMNNPVYPYFILRSHSQNSTITNLHILISLFCAITLVNG